MQHRKFEFFTLLFKLLCCPLVVCWLLINYHCCIAEHIPRTFNRIILITHEESEIYESCPCFRILVSLTFRILMVGIFCSVIKYVIQNLLRLRKTTSSSRKKTSVHKTSLFFISLFRTWETSAHSVVDRVDSDLEGELNGPWETFITIQFHELFMPISTQAIFM